jgi:hypothetical protein
MRNKPAHPFPDFNSIVILTTGLLLIAAATNILRWRAFGQSPSILPKAPLAW